MFEKIGYEFEKDGYGIIYSKYEKYHFKVIEFLNKEIFINEDDEYDPSLLIDELQAINQQCKELGWFDEKN